MAEQKSSRFQRALEFLNRPPERTVNKLQNEIKSKVEALHMKDEIIRQKDIEIANLKGGT